MARTRRVLIWILLPIAIYAGLCAAVWALQDALVFPGAGGPDVELLVPPGVTVGELVRDDGERFRVATSVPENPAALVLFFVGNGENLHSALLRAQDLSRYGVASVIPEYPGYGRSSGRASMASLLEVADATAIHAASLAQELGVDLVVAGSSLGSFLAVHLAARGVGQRMLLKAPPTSMVEAGSNRFPWLPVSLLLRHRFDSLALAPQVQCPVLVVHGAADTLVPPEMGRRLVEAFGSQRRGEARYLEVPGHGHNHPSISTESPVAPEVRSFLRGS